MPIKINAGLCKKIGEPNYGSRGASINIEIELDGQLIHEPERLKERIRQLYGLARTSLDEELRQGAPATNGHTNDTPAPVNGTRLATASQVKAIQTIAKRHGLDITPHLRRFGVAALGELTVKQASAMIDELKTNGHAGGARP